MKDNWHKNGDLIFYKHDFENQVTIIEIAREKHLNALNSTVISSLEKVLNIINLETRIRSVIITGKGDKAFVAGADIKEFQGFNKKEARNLSQSGKEKLFDKIANFRKPVISAINGYALGGGLELALSCHLRVATETAKLGLPECTLGLIPGYGGTQRLPKIIGIGHAMEMILTGKMISAQDAYRIKLVNHIVPGDRLIEKCLSITKYFNKTSPEALSSAINSINSCFLDTGSNIESKEFSELFQTTNFKEGVEAFLEKRKPNFNQ